jgi:hypothetical protein
VQGMRTGTTQTRSGFGGRQMNARRVTLLAASVVMGLGLLAPVARAGGLRFLAPLSNGTVDFGDRVLYRLEGAGCNVAKVEIRVASPDHADAVGRPSHAARDPLAQGSCLGIAEVPSEAAVRATGWDDGDRITIEVSAGDAKTPLRYQRVEVDHGTPAPGYGNPTLVRPHKLAEAGRLDPRTSDRDAVMSMSTGDVMSLGSVDLTHIHSISLRVCVTQPKPHVTPSFVELRAGGPDAPSIIGRVDVADDVNNSNKSNFGWPNCWQLQPWPIINKVPGRAPELYLAMVATAMPVEVNFIDFNGTGAKVPDTPPTDPQGTQQIFDGDFDGWTHTDRCTVDDDGSVRGVHSTEPQNYAPLATFGFVGEEGCEMTYATRQFENAVFRFEYRLQDFGDNGAVYVAGHEIQMRQAGEWMTGGLQGNSLPDALTNFAIQSPVSGYPAQRIKSNSYPDWSQMEIVFINGRYIVRINGRTVTDCSIATQCPSEPGPYNFRFQSQPGFSYHYGVGWRMDTGPTNPVTDDPSNWGNISFRNFRSLDCTDSAEPLCNPGPKTLRG